MQTTNFQCGHCGNLMAVTANMLGQQVRCPNCQQVVLAPAPAPTGTPAETDPPNPFAPAGETELAPEVFAEASRPAPRPARRGSSWVVPVLIIPLISYSAMVTALLLWQIYKPPPPHPLELFR